MLGATTVLIRALKGFTSAQILLNRYHVLS
jgi:hypothetical protein